MEREKRREIGERRERKRERERERNRERERERERERARERARERERERSPNRGGGIKRHMVVCVWAVARQFLRAGSRTPTPFSITGPCDPLWGARGGMGRALEALSGAGFEPPRAGRGGRRG